MEARSNNPQQGPGAEAREIFEIFTSPDLWKSLFHRLKTLGFELLKPLKSVKPVHLKKWENMGMRENAGEISLEEISLGRRRPNAGVSRRMREGWQLCSAEKSRACRNDFWKIVGPGHSRKCSKSILCAPCRKFQCQLFNAYIANSSV